MPDSRSRPPSVGGLGGFNPSLRRSLTWVHASVVAVRQEAGSGELSGRSWEGDPLVAFVRCPRKKPLGVADGLRGIWAVIEIKMAGCVDARLAVGQFQVQGLALLGEASTSATSITADTLVSSTEPRDWEISFHWTAWKQFPSEPLRQLIMVRLQSFRHGMCQCMLLQKPGAAFRAVD